MSRSRSVSPGLVHDLDLRRAFGDALGDKTIGAIAGVKERSADPGELEAAARQRKARLQVASGLLRHMADSARGASGNATREAGAAPAHPPLADFLLQHGKDPEIAATLGRFVEEAQVFPEWRDEGKLARASEVFVDFGPWSCLILFCASLPETYMVPGIADVLQTSAELKKNVLNRIRGTASMLFPVLTTGGLDRDGPGVAQTLMVRLIHATIRDLIRDPLEHVGPKRDIYDCFSSFSGERGPDAPVPCNQQELAYVALTLGYVYVRSLRRLGMPLRDEDEDAYLHVWSVVAHLLGVQIRVPDTMRDAKSWYKAIRQSSEKRAAAAAAARDPRSTLKRTVDACTASFASVGRAITGGKSRPAAAAPVDPRRVLGQALLSAMETALRGSDSRWHWKRCLTPLPGVFIRHLCGHHTAQTMGLGRPTNLLAWALVMGLIYTLRAIDFIPHLLKRKFSVGRLVTRVVGYHVMYELLESKASPLELPVKLQPEVKHTLQFPDRRAATFMQKVEDKLTRDATCETKPAEKK